MSNRFVIEPNKSVGNIIFGELRENIRKLLGNEYKEFRKTKFSSNTTDDYGFCHIYYDEENRCEAIEFFDDIELILKEKNLFSMSYDDLKMYIQSIDSNVEIDNTGITSKFLNISVYAPGNSVESIIAACNNYY